MTKNKIPVCKEMKKLRKWLDDNNIQWEDKSEGHTSGSLKWWMCRTWFTIGNHRVSVINGCGSYGGGWPLNKRNLGLLEIMCSWLPDVEGYLKADDVIKIVEEQING